MGGCGFFDFGCQIGHAIDSWFAGLVSSAMNPLFGLLGKTLLSTPQVGNFATVRELWTGSLVIADTCYVLLVLLGGVLIMSHQTVQTSYAIKDIAPRIAVGLVAANLSLLVAGKAIMFANGMSGALAGQGLNPVIAGAMMRGLVERSLTESGMFFILLALFAVLLVFALALIFAARLMLTVVLIAIAPLALACHALPQTEGFAFWWWRAFAGILAIESVQALVLVAAIRVFFTEGWSSLILSGAPGSPAVIFATVQLICLLYILIRIPFWIYRRVWSPGGRSPARSAARYVFAAAVLSRVSPVFSGRLGSRGRPQARPGAGRTRPSGRGPRGPGPTPARPPRTLGSNGPGARTRQATRAQPPPMPDGSPAQPARHAAPAPLPDGGSGHAARHARPPLLPGDLRSQPARPSTGQVPLPSAAVRPSARHAKPPPLPGGSARHAQPAPLPAARAQPPAAKPGPAHRPAAPGPVAAKRPATPQHHSTQRKPPPMPPPRAPKGTR